MNEQLPPQSIEEQIRVLDGLFASMGDSRTLAEQAAISRQQLRDEQLEAVLNSPHSQTMTREEAIEIYPELQGMNNRFQVAVDELPSVQNPEAMIETWRQTGVTFTSASSATGWSGGVPRANDIVNIDMSTAQASQILTITPGGIPEWVTVNMGQIGKSKPNFFDRLKITRDE